MQCLVRLVSILWFHDFCPLGILSLGILSVRSLVIAPEFSLQLFLLLIFHIESKFRFSFSVLMAECRLPSSHHDAEQRYGRLGLFLRPGDG